MTTTTQLLDLPLEQLTANTDNLRQDLGDLTELAASIDAVGIIEPLVVEVDDPETMTYRVLAGHRRLAAARLHTELATVPCVVRHIANDAERTEVMLIENLQRTGLNPIEEAAGYHQLTKCGLAQREIAERVGCNQSHVSKRLKLHRLPDQAKAMVVDGTLTVNDALDLADLVDLDEASATEWLAAPGWPHISERIRRAETAAAIAAARAEGEASGLPEVEDVVGFREVEREHATHWGVDWSGELWWGVERSDVDGEVDQKSETKPKSSTATPPKPAKPSQWQLDQEAAKVRRERRNQWIRDLPDTELAAAATDVLMSWMRGEYGNLELDAGVLGPLGVDINEINDQMLTWLIVLASGLHAIQIDDASDDNDREALAAAARHGYELDDTERAFLGEERLAELLDAASAATFAEDDPIDDTTTEWVEAPRQPATDEQFATVDADPAPEPPTDPLAVTTDIAPPWKAYPYVDTTKLIAGIAEHGNIDKLRHAITYETANGGRGPVLTALEARIAELEAA